MARYVQYGCGFSPGEGWLNFDASPTLRIERLPVMGRALGRLSGNERRFPQGVRFGDIVAGLPVEDGSVDGLYASHVLEHLSLADCRQALANSRRMLRPGGVFRLIVPDLKARARAYLEAGDDPAAAHAFLRSTGLGRDGRGAGLRAQLRGVLGNSEHLWMYDLASMTAELERAGFVDIRAARIGDSGDAMFDRVEDPARFADEGMTEVAVQARRPSDAAHDI